MRAGLDKPVGEQDIQRPKPKGQFDDLDQFIANTLKELKDYHISYEGLEFGDKVGQQGVYDRVVRARSLLNRVEGMLTEAQRIRRTIRARVVALTDVVEFKMGEALIKNAQPLAAKGFAWEERRATALRSVVDERIELRKWEKALGDVDCLVEVLQTRYRHLASAVSDGRLLSQLVAQGESLHPRV